MPINKEISFYNDNVSTKDSLGFRPYVEAIAEFLTTELTKPPITLSIEGQWGCGKSSFMKQLKEYIEALNEDEDEQSKVNISLNIKNKAKIKINKFFKSPFRRKKYFTIWFNSWRYDKEDQFWAAFALNLIEKLSKQLSLTQRIWARFNLTVLRLKFKLYGKSSFIANIFILFILLCFTFFISVPKFNEVLTSHSTDGLLKNFMVLLIGFIGPILPTFYLGKDLTDAIVNPFDFRKYSSSPNYEEHVSFIEQFHSDFSKIIESYAGKSRVYVFIDDLDRCEVPKAAELMQAINLMISEEAKIYFCIGMDRKVISAGLVAKNENVCKYLIEDVSEYKLEYGYNFIEKFIQIPFKVPSPKIEDIKELLDYNQENESYQTTEISAGVSFGIFDSLLSINHESIKKSSANGDLRKQISQEIENNQKYEGKIDLEDEKVLNDLDCSERSESNNLSENFKDIMEMVTPALDNNPRRIKQFLNLFRFQKTIGLKTGLFTYNKETAHNQMWNCHKLAKFIALCIKWPSIISVLNSNTTFLEELQIYALKPENKNKNLEKLLEDEKLVTLLKYGCVENNPQKEAEYTLLGLDFSKLLDISPVVQPPVSALNQKDLDTIFSNVVLANYKCFTWSTKKYPLINLFGEIYVPLLSREDSLWNSHVDKLAKFILDSNTKYTLKTGEKLDLGQGYSLHAKQIDVEGKKVWLELTLSDRHIDDNIVSIDSRDNTWTYERDNVEGIYNVTVFKIHINNILRGATDNIVQIDGLWLIDFEKTMTIKVGSIINSCTLTNIINGNNRSNLGRLIFKQTHQTININVPENESSKTLS